MKRYERFVAGGFLSRQLPELELVEPAGEDIGGDGWRVSEASPAGSVAWDDLAPGADRIFD